MADRKALASAIALHAGARRGLEVAEQALEHAQRNCWQVQSALEELQRAPIAPDRSFASQLAASIMSGKACSDAGVLERPRDDVRARIALIERNIAVWQEAISECEAAVRDKAAVVAAAQERVAKAARVVIANSGTIGELASFAITFDVLTQKNASAQRAIGECEAALAAAIQGVIAEEVSPLLPRMQDCERAAAMLRSELRALQHCGGWGLAPVSLPDRLRAEPANVFHADRPLNWHQQKSFDGKKRAWVDFADLLRTDADATRSLGD